MPRNMIAAQKRTQDFYKGDTLAQTYQIKYEGCFRMTQKTQKRYFLKILY